MMKSTLVASGAAILAGLGVQRVQAEQYVLETQPAQRIEAVLTQEIRAPGLEADEWVAFIARPIDLAGQTQVEVKSVPNGIEVTDLSDLKRPLMMIRAPGKQSGAKDTFKVVAKYQATLHSRVLRRVGASEGTTRAKPPATADLGQAAIALSDHERQQWLTRSSHFDFESGALQEWIKTNDLMRDDDECEIDFARRVFSTIKTGFKYDYRAEMDRRASSVCTAKTSDCGGLSVLFVSALRANNVPARVLVGRWALSSKLGEHLNGIRYHQCHVKAEFFAENVGWVPVDMSSAILHDAGGDGMQYFGRDRGDFITMHLDPDIVVNTMHFGHKQTPWLQGVTFWVTGQGNLDKLSTEENWTVKKTRIE